jgi:TRAP-type transport system periplasmic protein
VEENYARMRAAGVAITTALPPDFQQTLRAAGQVAVDDWMQRMGPAATPILDAYRRRLGR